MFLSVLSASQSREPAVKKPAAANAFFAVAVLIAASGVTEIRP
jgi:hypothetical protein